MGCQGDGVDLRHLQKVVVYTYFTPILTFPHQGGRDFWTAPFSIEGEGTFEIVLWEGIPVA